jgi:hypothetical protein
VLSWRQELICNVLLGRESEEENNGDKEVGRMEERKQSVRRNKTEKVERERDRELETER